MTSTAFRQCRPSDREKALPLIISSGPEAFHYVFCDRQSEQLTSFLERAFVAKGNEFSHDQHLALIDNDQLVAVGALRYAEQTNRFTLAAMRLIFAHYSPLAALRTAWRGLRTESVIKPPGKGVAFIYQLAVCPEQRSRGFGRQMIAELLSRASQQGYRRAGLNVSVENPRAQALYEQLGFRVQREYSGELRSPYGYVPGQRYIECELHATNQ